MRPQQSGVALRICSVAHREAVALARRADALEGVRELGFEALLLPPEVWAACTGASTLDPGVLSFAALRDLAQSLSTAGLGVFLDVDLGALPLEHPLVQAHPDAFAIRPITEELASIDPRRRAAASGQARMRRRTVETALLLDWAASTLGEAFGAGVRGVRFLSPAGFEPAFWTALTERVGATAMEATFIAATAGLDRPSVVALDGCGFDYLTSSLAWWDARAPWLIEEYEALRRIAPLIADFGDTAEGAPRVQASPAAYARSLHLAAAMGAGAIVPMNGTAEGGDLPILAEAMRAANRQTVELAGFDGEMRLLTGAGSPATALLRAAGPDLRAADTALLVLVNPDLDRPASFSSADLGPLGAMFGPYARIDGEGEPFAPLEPGQVRLLTAGRQTPILIASKGGKAGAKAAAEAPRIAIEALSPSVDGGRFAVKRTAGDPVVVEADIFADGHEQLAAELLWRPVDAEDWRPVRMEPLGNDRWRAEFTPERMGRHLFAVEAWVDRFGGLRRDFAKKLAAGVAGSVDVQEAMMQVQAARDRSGAGLRLALGEMLADLDAANEAAKAELLLSPDLARLMDRADARPFSVRGELQALDAERLGARFASWYELFPRSQTDDPARHGTFDDVIARLPAVRAMGFDVVYFPPIHPIGRKNRKGRNNSLTAGPDDPGSPYAIGSEEGGHDAVHPELGGLEGFERLIAAARQQGLEVALDFAIQCAPDHPWLKQHPGWFDYRPDGTIKYAENPPKTYEDIVNVDFYKPDSVPGLWLALRDAVLFWAERGVRLFRVDNPHTKPLPFWAWMIADVRGRYPDAVFLAEAFTRPKVMYRLAKVGFSQSYTYFTWRHTKAELTDYLVELTTTAPKEFFRPHFFVNTPDINPYFLIRAALAATLSGLFGVYSGFELLEADPVPGKEEYKDSEKYEIKPRDWNQPGNIIAEITRLNAIRKANPALQTHLGVIFYKAFNDSVLYFGKATAAKADMVLVAVNLDPHNPQAFDFEIPLWEWGLPDDGALEVEDLLRDSRFTWRGKVQRMTLTPDQPYAIWRVQPLRQA